MLISIRCNYITITRIMTYLITFITSLGTIILSVFTSTNIRITLIVAYTNTRSLRAETMVEPTLIEILLTLCRFCFLTYSFHTIAYDYIFLKKPKIITFRHCIFYPSTIFLLVCKNINPSFIFMFSKRNNIVIILVLHYSYIIRKCLSFCVQ